MERLVSSTSIHQYTCRASHIWLSLIPFLYVKITCKTTLNIRLGAAAGCRDDMTWLMWILQQNKNNGFCTGLISCLHTRRLFVYRSKGQFKKLEIRQNDVCTEYEVRWGRQTVSVWISNVFLPNLVLLHENKQFQWQNVTPSEDLGLWLISDFKVQRSPFWAKLAFACKSLGSLYSHTLLILTKSSKGKY